MIKIASSIGKCQVKRGMTPMRTHIDTYQWSGQFLGGSLILGGSLKSLIIRCQRTCQ